MNRSHSTAPARRPVAVIGRGRLGSALAAALRWAGHPVSGPLGRSYAARDLDGVGVVLLAVPDREIARAAATVLEHLPAGGPLIGHCSGATGLEPLLEATGGRFDALSLHPLMTVTPGEDAGGVLRGAAAAVAGSSERALAAAADLARAVGLLPVSMPERDRAAYHAAASLASNFLVTLEMAAERLALTAGVDREHLVPLVRATVENWAGQGPGALTGPIARGDEQTVARQRVAVAERTPELLPLFDTLADATRALAAGARPEPEPVTA